MPKFFYLDNNSKQCGPFEASDLKTKPVFGHTLVWTQGMENWEPAENVPQLAFLFELPQNEIEPQQQTNPSFYTPPANESLGIIWGAVAFLLPLVGFGYSLIMRKKKPLASRQAAYLAIAGMLLNLILNYFWGNDLPKF